MSSTNKKNIAENEFYPTPRPLAKAFIEIVDWEKLIQLNPNAIFIEPCRGDGAIYDQIPLDLKCYAEIRDGIDYLSNHDVVMDCRFDATITNPPFSLFEKFLHKSLVQRSATGFVAYLLRVNALGSKKRVTFWRDEVGYPDKLIVCTPRPNFSGSGTDSCEYAWFCYDPHDVIRAPKGPSILEWEKPSKRKATKTQKAETHHEQA